MQIFKQANLALSFLLELGLMAAFGFWGFQTGTTTIAKIGLCVLAVLMFVLIWGIFMAPRSSRRLQMPWFLILELVLFSLGVWALYSTGMQSLALTLGLLFVINQIILYI